MSQPPAHVLESLSIASPCTADWEAMTGSDRVRFCGQCQLNVYNLSAMTREDAETLVQTTEGRLCVRYFQRFDGTVITRDCPVGLQALHRRKISKIRRLSRFAAAVTVMTVVGSFCVSLAGDTTPAKPTMQMMGAPAVQDGRALQGDVAQPTEKEGQTIQGNMAQPTVEQGRTIVGEVDLPRPQPALQPPAPPSHPTPLMGKIAVPHPENAPPQSPDQQVDPSPSSPSQVPENPTP